MNQKSNERFEFQKALSELHRIFDNFYDSEINRLCKKEANEILKLMQLISKQIKLYAEIRIDSKLSQEEYDKLRAKNLREIEEIESKAKQLIQCESISDYLDAKMLSIFQEICDEYADISEQEIKKFIEILDLIYLEQAHHEYDRLSMLSRLIMQANLMLQARNHKFEFQIY